MLIGVPVVRPSNTPERICTWSASWRADETLLWPTRRRSSSRWISASPISSPAGQPSTTQPTAGPCDSPQVVMRNAWPKLLPGIVSNVFLWRSNGKRLTPRVELPPHQIAALAEVRVGRVEPQRTFQLIERALVL